MMICPSVISWAIPRPATIRTSVATIGWILHRGTSKPFQSPHSTAAPSVMRMTRNSGVAVRRSRADQPGRHRGADRHHRTDRQVNPAVAITRVMPMASSMIGAPGSGCRSGCRRGGPP